MLSGESVPDAAALGNFIQLFFYIAGSVAAVVVAIVEVYRALRKKEPSPNSEFVTRGELLAGMNSLQSITTTEINRIEQVAKDEVRRVEASTRDSINRLEVDVKDLRSYMRDRIHTLSNKVHVINLRMVYLSARIDQVCNKLGIPPSAGPEISPGDEA